MLKFLWTLPLFASIMFVTGQSLTPSKVSGLVVDHLDQPIAGASIASTELSSTSVADENGVFEMMLSDRTVTNIQITAMGYVALDTTVELIGNQPLVIVLDEQTQQLEEVHVQGEELEQKTAIISRLSSREIGQSKGESVAEVFASLDGVSLLSSGHRVHKPVLHGLHSNRILILNQGVKLEGQQWGLEHAPELDPFTADQFELIKGAQAVRYGADALGGVLIAKSKPLDPDHLQGRADLVAQSNGRGGAFNLELTGGIPTIPGLAWRAQGSARRLGDSQTADYFLRNTGLSELNFSTALQYRKAGRQWDAYYSRFGTKLGVFYGAHIGTVEDVLARIEHGRPREDYDFSYSIGAPMQQVVHDLGKLSYKGLLGQTTELQLQYAWQRNHRKEYDMRRTVADDVPMSDMVLSSHQVDLMLKIADHRFGLQASNQVNNNVAGTGTTPFIPNYDQYGLGVFGIHSFNIGRSILETGWRYDFRYFDAAGYRYRYPDGELPEQYLMSDQRKFHNFSGSLGVAFPVSAGWQYKSHLGLAWRAPTANELYSDGLHHGAAIYEIGKIDLKPEQALKWVHSINREIGRWYFGGELYGQWIHNYIYAQPHPDSVRQTIRGTFPIFGYQQHNALFYGVDLQARWTILTGLEYDVSASLVKARNISEDRYLPHIPSDRLQQSLRWSFQKDRESYLSITHEFVARQGRYENGSDFAAPPGAYHLLHMHLAYPVAWNENQLNLALGVDNLMNRSYKDYMDRFRYYAHREGRNITLSLNLKF
ncbi:MAG: TonB-dependent receptor [Sphingobacterium sp.]